MSAFPLLRWPLHGGEEHEVRNGIDEDLQHGEKSSDSNGMKIGHFQSVKTNE